MTSSLADRLIPGFGGQIFTPGTVEYDEKRVQYAFSSYPEKQRPGGCMRPYLIAYPRMDADDIPAAISFARANNKRLVARSGGHQYCGLSSGGDDTILLGMDLYKHLEITTAGDKTLARVGVGTRLTDLAAAFKENGFTIPHGECPRVAIGGHAQSGGYGHLLRSYGLALDHVLEFKIYTSDGTLRTVHRPPARRPRTRAAYSGASWAAARGVSAF
jgi:FAD/FMN-containing dehydrogenase